MWKESWLDLELFVGLEVDPVFLDELDQTPPELRSLYLSSGHYLTRIDVGDQIYIGKRVGAIVDTESFESLRANIYAMIGKLVPRLKLEGREIILLPVPAGARA